MTKRNTTTPTLRLWYRVRSSWVRFTLRPLGAVHIDTGECTRTLDYCHDDETPCVRETQQPHRLTRFATFAELATVPAWIESNKGHYHAGERIFRPRWQILE